MNTKELCISRKVIGFPLKVRREQFAGVGSEQNFSQTNSKEASVSAKTQESSKAGLKTKLVSIKKPLSARYFIHAAVFVAVLTFVSVGRISASQAINTRGDGSTKDQTSMIATGAMLANSTQSLVANDISQRAQDLTNMSSFATAGDDFLAKRSPVMTAGAPNREISTYKVKDGDTLASLSQKFNITSDTIKWANNIADENQIKPGTDLTILPVSGVLYTAKDGDDLLAIAQQYQSNAALIESFNQLEGKGPSGGMKLIIPDGVIPAPAAPTVATAGTASTGDNGFFGSAKFSGGGNTYTWGQCTWYVASRRSVPGNWGNAYNWYYNAQRSGFGTGSTPRAGAIGWERMNHVVYVESVNGDGTVTISEMNWGGRPGVVHYRTTPASHFLYIY